MMKERTLEAIQEAEEYFVAVIEQEARGNIVPSRTEELHWAIEGLEGICFIKYKHWLKDHCEDMKHEEITKHISNSAVYN